MAETKLRRSKQRDTIYDMLVNDHTHPTAEVIYSHVRRIIPDISLGTVYRNLNVLVENGYIRCDTTSSYGMFKMWKDCGYTYSTWCI